MAIKTSDLDFQNIKSSLKTFLRQTPEFADYDFEASGLSNILDVLAYNTHLNGLIANMGINESFLSSAQLRASVVGHAETLGYYPKSRTTSLAYVSASIQIPDEPRPAFVTLPKGTLFTADVDEVTYGFITREDYVALDNNGTYVFKTSSGSDQIPIQQGQVKTKTFYVDGNVESSYVIPDETIDVSTLSVRVYDNFTAIENTVYDNINEVVTITPQSTVYMVRESANGYFEVFFSDGNVLGKNPVSGNKIVMEYMSTKGKVANTADSFETAARVAGKPVTVSLVTEAAGGSDKESVASIKLNAPRAFATQQRLVTAEDYRSLILANFGEYLDDVVAWGGNDNYPPQYGKVFVSLNFEDRFSETTQRYVKTQIQDNLTSILSIMSIDTEFVDPAYTNLELSITFNFDPAQTGLTAESMESRVLSAVSSYAERELSAFDSVFRRSNLLSTIDDLDPSILNSRMEVKANQTLDDLGATAFPFKIAIPDAEENTVVSEVFDYLGTACRIKNELGSNRLQVVDLDNKVRLTNIGSYEPSTGAVNIIEIDAAGLVVSVVPANQSTLRPLRNYIIDIDLTRSFASASTDNQVTKSIL